MRTRTKHVFLPPPPSENENSSPTATFQEMRRGPVYTSPSNQRTLSRFNLHFCVHKCDETRSFVAICVSPVKSRSLPFILFLKPFYY